MMIRQQETISALSVVVLSVWDSLLENEKYSAVRDERGLFEMEFCRQRKQ